MTYPYHCDDAEYAEALRDAIEEECLRGGISDEARDRILRAGDHLLPTADDVRGILAGRPAPSPTTKEPQP